MDFGLCSKEVITQLLLPASHSQPCVCVCDKVLAFCMSEQIAIDDLYCIDHKHASITDKIRENFLRDPFCNSSLSQLGKLSGTHAKPVACPATNMLN